MAILEMRGLSTGSIDTSIDNSIPAVSRQFPGTKFASPTVHASHIRRVNALRRLERGAVGETAPTPVTIVHGYPGSGKTQLVATWLTEGAHPPALASNGSARLGERSRPIATTDDVVWISCDHRDSDPRRLWAALLTGLEPVIGDVLDERTQLSSVSPPDDGTDPSAEVLAAAVVNRLTELDVTVSIVLDDAHRATDAMASLSPLIDRLPAGNRLILITTRELPLPLHSLRIRRQVTELRQEHLDLSIEDVRRLVSAAGYELDGRELVHLHRATEGWLAPWVLHLTQLDNRTVRHRRDDRWEGPQDHVGGAPPILGHHGVASSTLHDEGGVEAPSGLDDFFRHAVLMEVDDPLRDFLFDVALLDEFTSEDCRRVFAEVDAEKMLQECAAHGMFLVGPDTYGSYRLHRMFKDFLRRERNGRDPEGDASVHRRAAVAYATAGRTTLAVRHHVLAGQLCQGVELIAGKLAGGGVEQHESVVKEWLGELDLDDVRATRSAHAYAAFALALAAAGDPQSALRWSLAAAAAPGGGDDHVRALTSMVDVRVGLHAGDPQRILRGCEVLHDAGSPSTVTPRPIIGRLGTIAARTWTEDTRGALAISDDHRPDRARTTIDDVCVGSASAYALAVQGDLHRARELGEWSIAAGRTLGINDHWPMATADLACAVALYEQGHSDHALERFSAVVARFGDRAPTIAVLGMTGRLRAQMATGTPNMEDVERLQAAARRLSPASPLQECVVAQQVRVALTLGEFGRAYESITQLRTPWRTAMWTARVAIATGDAERAAEVLESLVLPDSRRAKIDLAVVKARLARRTKDRENAATYVDEALELAVPELAVRPFFEDGTELWSIMRRQLSSYPSHLFHETARDIAAVDRAGSRSLSFEPSADAAAVLGTLRNREQEVLRLIAAKHSNREIAAMLYISLNTLKTHSRSLYRKLGASSRAEVVAIAKQLGVA